MKVRGKHALITGGSRGIGRGVALRLAQDGVKIGVHYFQNEKAAKQTLEDIRKAGGDGFVVQADLMKEKGIAQVFDKVKSEFGALDIFVANARPEVPHFFEAPFSISVEQWDNAMNSQAKAFLLGVREAVTLMGPGGRIIAMTYATGSRTGSVQPWVAMGAAKSAMESLVRYFAVGLAQKGITVNAISPGWTEDSVLNSLPEAAQTLIRDWHQSGWTPMRRLGTPKDVGDVVALLCTDEAQWITGQVIYADGGASLLNSEVPPQIQFAT